jgi:hypothetical protein
MGILLSVIAFFSAIIIGYIVKPVHYGSDLEKYILSKNPQNSGDVERLTFEYNQRLTNERII